jgi:hypothetical protein
LRGYNFKKVTVFRLDRNQCGREEMFKLNCARLLRGARFQQRRGDGPADPWKLIGQELTKPAGRRCRSQDNRGKSAFGSHERRR